MKALVLVGGLGTRLRPLTLTRPKPLLPIANRPHIEHVVELLGHAGVREIVLLTAYLATAFEPIADAARRRRIRLSVVREPEPLGTAGALRNAAALVDAEPFLVLNGDILTNADLPALVDLHRRRRAEATILLARVEDPSAFGVVPIASDGRVLAFVEKPRVGEAPSNLINAGAYVLDPAVLGRIPVGRPSSAERELFPELVSDGRPVYALPTERYWRDIGTPSALLQANLDWLEGRVVGATADGGILAAEGARIEPGASVRAACLGERTIVESGAVVERSVLLPGVVVRSGAQVFDSVLGEGVVVAAGARAAGAVAGDGATLSRV